MRAAAHPYKLAHARPAGFQLATGWNTLGSSPHQVQPGTQPPEVAMQPCRSDQHSDSTRTALGQPILVRAFSCRRLIVGSSSSCGIHRECGARRWTQRVRGSRGERAEAGDATEGGREPRLVIRLPGPPVGHLRTPSIFGASPWLCVQVCNAHNASVERGIALPTPQLILSCAAHPTAHPA